MSSSSSSEVGHLGDAALKRKQRLEQLRKAKKAKLSGGGGGDQPEEAGPGQEALPKPLFRSYKPEAAELQESVLPEVVPGEVKDHVQEELATEHEKLEIEQLDFTSLAPRKPDWDLKRDIGPKLEKLERRTQRAIAELIRERLQEEDLANAVNAGAAAARQMAEQED